MSLILRNAIELLKYDYNKCHKINLSVFLLRHPNHLLLAGVNDRNVIIT